MGLLDSLRNRRALKELQLKTWKHHRQMLETAGGLSVAVLRCHDHTWRFIEGEAARRENWRSPEPTSVPDREDPIVEVRLSGPQLAIVIDRLAHVGDVVFFGGSSYRRADEQAIARRIYREISDVLEQCDPDNPTAVVPAIVLDDQIGTAPQPR